ncbi:MAG: hypothetical protein HPM95_05245 [Alphaproteobacteria bacterium]|nr:hypothetical protein [Alphaproteobacteria bacterium]
MAEDRKVAYVRLEGRLFGAQCTHVEMRLEVEIPSNAAAMALIAIRLREVPPATRLSGPVDDASAFRSSIRRFSSRT